jgi:hypothetical protein
MAKKRKKPTTPKLTCLYCETWHELYVNDAREKVFTKLCREEEITADTKACERFEPHNYFLCPRPMKQRLHLEVCYHLCNTKKCIKWKRCLTGRLVKKIVETYRRDYDE